MIRITGRDPNGIPRVYGEAHSAEEAERLARDEAENYLIRRPDCGPLWGWNFRPSLGPFNLNSDFSGVDYPDG